MHKVLLVVLILSYRPAYASHVLCCARGSRIIRPLEVSNRLLYHLLDQVVLLSFWLRLGRQTIRMLFRLASGADVAAGLKHLQLVVEEFGSAALHGVLRL